MSIDPAAVCAGWHNPFAGALTRSTLVSRRHVASSTYFFPLPPNQLPRCENRGIFCASFDS